MASLFKHGSNWWARWYRPGGKRVKRNTGSQNKREAQRIAAEMEAKDRREIAKRSDHGGGYQRILDRAAVDARAGRLTAERAEQHLMDIRRLADPSFRVVSLKEHLREWMDDQEPRVSASTASTYRNARRHLEAAFPTAVLRAPVGNLTRPQVESALRKIAGTKVQDTDRTIRAATVNQILRILRRALTQAVEDDLAHSNPAGSVKPRPESDSTERSPFTVEEVRALVDHKETSDEWRGAIMLGAHTGLRLSDVVALGRSHVQDSTLVIRPRKTARQRRTLRIPLTPPCVAWIGERKGHFFPELRRRPTGTLSTQFRRIMEKAGVPRDVTLPGGIKARRSFHSLRHSFASWLADADIHADVRQRLTGHTSAGIHQIYTHHDKTLARAIESLPQLV